MLFVRNNSSILLTNKKDKSLCFSVLLVQRSCFFSVYPKRGRPTEMLFSADSGLLFWMHSMLKKVQNVRLRIFYLRLSNQKFKISLAARFPLQFSLLSTIQSPEKKIMNDSFDSSLFDKLLKKFT